MYITHQHQHPLWMLNKSLFLQILVGFAVVYIALIILKFLHCFLLENLMPTLLLQFLRD